VDFASGKLTVSEYAAITTNAGTPFPKRLAEIHDDLAFVLDKYRPDFMAAERLFFTNNKTTGIEVAEARGVVILCAEQRGIPFYEYTPPQVKQAVTGYGNATKRQVQEMVCRILSLYEIPKPDDTADALAVAICAAHSIGNSVFNTGKVN
jgi:crossover junction endodeoxyribonuclease RuvC